MANEILKSLLKEYEQKRIRAELDLEKRKEELYKQIPRLGEIENELNNYAISTAKNILNNNSYSLEKFYSHFNELKKEKDEILKKENIDASYLQPQYECNICKDTGYILNSDYKTDMCNCLKQKLLDISFNKSNIYNLSKENFSTFNEKIFSDKVDIAKFKYNISPRQNIINIKQKCIEFVENFDDPNCKNLLFTGNTGLRKNFYV